MSLRASVPLVVEVVTSDVQMPIMDVNSVRDYLTDLQSRIVARLEALDGKCIPPR